MKKEKACKKLKGTLQVRRSSQFSCTSMEPVLPADLIIEILLRLPVIYLLQFRCVSKSWLALISSPEFIKTHLMIATNNKYCTHLMLNVVQTKNKLMECSISSLLYESITKVVELDHPMKKQNKYINVVGSIDGLVCLILGGEDFVIWNPSIRKFKKFSNFGSGNPCMYGFGYDKLQGDYKVLVFSNEYGFKPDKIHLYSLNSDSWKSLGAPASEGIFINSVGIFVNEKLHWAKTTCEKLNPFNLSKSKDIYSYDSWTITSIDLADGKLGNIEVPYYERGDLNISPRVAVMGSHLSVFCNNQNTSASDVWIMKEYGIKESWTKLFTINWPCDKLSRDDFCPFFVMSNEDEIMCDFQADILIYNPKDNSIQYKRVSNCKTFWDKSIYIESLVWPFPSKEPRMSNSCNHYPVFNNRK